ncbi:carbohydrate porin [Succinivibrio sp.]|uniref:carbohydrate porin n=1 Tax=Succinivibrio sp. TaxID=2053619 RepID=UPI00386F29D2
MSAQASAAVTPDVALKGDSSYFRSGVYSRHFNSNKGNVGRLGNEHDNYIELSPSVTLAEVDGTDWRFTTTFAMQSQDNGAWQATDKAAGSGEDIAFANLQAFLRVSGLLDSDKGAALWVGKKYVRVDSHVVDAYWRNVSGNGVGIENLSLGSGKLRANWTRRDDSLNFTTKAQGYTAVKDPSRTATNMFDVEYGFAPFDSSWASVGYTLVAPQRYASEYSNYGYKVKEEVGNGHLFTAVLGEALLGGWNNTVVRYVKGSTAGAGLWSHTYTGSKDSSSYNIDIIDFGAVNFTENFNMLYHTWFNFSKVKNSLSNSETHGRDFQLIVRPQYKLTKMTRLILEAGMFTSSSDTTNFGDDSETTNTQQQKLTLAYAITPDAGNAWSRPEIRFFATYKHFGHNEGRTGTYDHDYTVKNEAGTVESLYTGRKTEVYFGAQAEAWF